MSDFSFSLCGAALLARPDGALHWPEAHTLVVSDLHLGKSERMARRGGALLPPYDTLETLARLAAAVSACAPETIVCLGDSFDDVEASEALDAQARALLAGLMAGRRWVWIAGNHDPVPGDLGGGALSELALGPLRFRHIAEAGAALGEVSGHYHPKARLPGGGAARPCFLVDGARVVLPAFGAYTGGLATQHMALDALMRPGALAVLTGRRAIAAPMPRDQRLAPRPDQRDKAAS
jgi:DNA ligase-associated metallophosphoesterase